MDDFKVGAHRMIRLWEFLLVFFIFIVGPGLLWFFLGTSAASDTWYFLAQYVGL